MIARTGAGLASVACAAVLAGCTIPVHEAAAALPGPVAPRTAHVRIAPTLAPVALAPVTVLPPVPAPDAVSPPVVVAPAPLPPCVASPLNCSVSDRVDAVTLYLHSRPGTVGYVLRDRVSGEVFRNDQAGQLVWMASTIKLAMAADLLARNRAGIVTLTDEDRADIEAMLNTSDNDAADALWDKYSGTDHKAFNRDFAKFGMTNLIADQAEGGPYWGLQECTPADLDALMQYMLDQAAPEDRDYLVSQMQNVDAVQQWGVWGAGSAASPGNKNGWSDEDSGWVTNSVGFAGPGQRYTLSIMNSLDGQGGYDEGVVTTTTVARALLSDRG